MKPTNQFRWYRTKTVTAAWEGAALYHTNWCITLQQLWEPEGTTEKATRDPEWREVETVTEPDPVIGVRQ
jgi:hypothetical protein